MDLTAVPGIGPEYRRRLVEAGVPDVAALASATDLDALAERSGIPPGRLATLRAAALDLGEEAGIAITTVAPFQDVAQTLWRSAEDVREAMVWRLHQAESTVRGKAVEAVSALERRLASLRAALSAR